MKTTNLTPATRAALGSNPARNLPALPAGWTIKGEYMRSEDSVERYVLDSAGRVDRAKVATVLENYDHNEHANAWRYGSEVESVNGDMLAALGAIATQAELTARTFPNAPGRGDWIAVERMARAAIAKATARANGEKGGSVK